MVIRSRIWRIEGGQVLGIPEAVAFPDDVSEVELMLPKRSQRGAALIGSGRHLSDWPKDVTARAAIPIIFISILMGCSEPAKQRVVTRDQYGTRWPWPMFDRGTISCSRDRVLIKLGDVTYGLNGLSRAKYPDPRELMEREPGTADISADGRGVFRLGATSELIQVGLRLCEATR